MQTVVQVKSKISNNRARLFSVSFTNLYTLLCITLSVSNKIDFERLKSTPMIPERKITYSYYYRFHSTSICVVYKNEVDLYVNFT